MNIESLLDPTLRGDKVPFSTPPTVSTFCFNTFPLAFLPFTYMQSNTKHYANLNLDRLSPASGLPRPYLYLYRP